MAGLAEPAGSASGRNKKLNKPENTRKKAKTKKGKKEAKTQKRLIMKDIHKELNKAIIKALEECEAAGDLVIATSTPMTAAARISERVRETFTGDIFTPDDLLAISSLIYHATSDKRFYDSEMTTLTGYSSEKMQELGKQIRELTAL